MNDKKMYDLLNNSNESNIERLTEGKKVMTDAERERIFAMSKNKLNNMKRMAANNGSARYVDSDYVNGVEKYNKPIITKFAGMAAAVLLICGISGGVLMAHHINGNHPGDVDLPPAATNATTSAASYTSTANTYTTPANTVTTITEVDGTTESEQKHSTESSAQNITSEAETTPKSTVKTTEAVSEPEKATTPAVSAEDQELIDAATRLTDDYYTLFCVKYGWLSYDKSDYFSLESPGVSSPIGGLPYYRVSDEHFNTIEKIRAYMTSHCTSDSMLYVDVDRINDIDTVGELITENTVYKNLYKVSDDYNSLYFLKDGKLYVNKGQLGFNFEGWCEQPVEIISKSENEFVARRGHYSMEYKIYYDDYTFKKDPYTGNWLLDSETPV